MPINPTHQEKTSIAKKAIVVLMGIVLVFSIIEGAITGYLVHSYNKHHTYPSHSIRDRVRFLLFCSWWTVVWAIAYITFHFTAAAGSVIGVVLNTLALGATWVFWLGGSASLSAAMRHRHYGNTVHHSQLRAGEGFGWATWILLTFDMLVALYVAFDTSRNGNPGKEENMRQIESPA